MEGGIYQLAKKQGIAILFAVYTIAIDLHVGNYRNSLGLAGAVLLWGLLACFSQALIKFERVDAAKTCLALMLIIAGFVDREPNLLRCVTFCFLQVACNAEFLLRDGLLLAPSMVVNTLRLLGREEKPVELVCLSWVVFASALAAKSRGMRREAKLDELCERSIRKLEKKRNEITVKNKFIATLTHEMRNLAYCISTNSALLLDNRTWSEDIVSELCFCSKALVDMLNNALDISKLEEGKIDFHKRYESIHELVEMVVRMHRGGCEEKGVKLDSCFQKLVPYKVEVDKPASCKLS